MKDPKFCRYTFQTWSESGSFASPVGEDVSWTDSMASLYFALEEWADEHRRVGAAAQDASLMVWKGFHEDVTDIYPDFQLKVGPRGGFVKEAV